MPETRARQCIKSKSLCALDGQVQQGQGQAGWSIPPVNIAIPTFGYQNHVSIDREHGLIRRWEATDAAAYQGAAA